MDKIAKFEAMGSGFEASSERPCTPSNQVTNGIHCPSLMPVLGNADTWKDYFPQTPVEASIKQESTPLQPPNRFSEGYDESMEETLKPVRQKHQPQLGNLPRYAPTS
jgi:regulatory protein SWI5